MSNHTFLFQFILFLQRLKNYYSEFFGHLLALQFQNQIPRSHTTILNPEPIYSWAHFKSLKVSSLNETNNCTFFTNKWTFIHHKDYSFDLI